MAKKWRVAVLGLGHWYSGYGLARALPEYPKAELVAVADLNAAHANEFGSSALTPTLVWAPLSAKTSTSSTSPPVRHPQCVIGAQAGGMIMGKPWP